MKLHVVLLLSLLGGAAMAQEHLTDTARLRPLVKFPLATVEYFYYPTLNFDTEVGEAQTTVSELRTSFQAAFPLKAQKTYLLNRVQYSLLQYEADVTSQALRIEDTYHTIQYTIGLLQILPKRWRLVFNVSPTLASDFRAPLSSNDFILQLSALALKRANKNVQYGFGLAYTTRFGDPLFLPLIQLTYKKNNWLTSVVLPAYVAQYYEFNESSRLGLKTAVYGNFYNVNANRDGSTIDRVAYSRVTIGPEYRLRLLDNLYVTTAAGVTVGNLLRIENDPPDEKLELNADSRFFFNVGLSFLR